MKNLFKYALILTVAAGFVACAEKEVEDVYTVGEADSATCYGVSFPKQDATGSHTFDPEAAKSMTFTAKRTRTDGDITVPVEIVDTAGVFHVGDIVFADGQEETTFDVTFEEASLGVKYGLSVSITDPEYAAIYGAGVSTFNFDVMVVTWQYFMNPKTNEPAVVEFTQNWWGETAWARIKFYEVDGVRTCFTETLPEHYYNGPYTGYGFFGIGETPESEEAVEITFKWYTNQKNSYGNDLIELPAQFMGYTDGSGYKRYMSDYLWYYIFKGDLSASNWLANAVKYGDPDGDYPCGYYDGNGGFYLYVLGYYRETLAGSWTEDYDIVGISEGFVRTDFTIKEFEADYSADGETPVYLETGKDVSYVKYAVYPGELTSTQALNKAPLIADGTDASVKFDEFELDEDTNTLYATLLLAPETTGDYTVVVATFNDKDEYTGNAAYAAFYHVAAGDVEDNEVHVSVFTEDTPARYQTLHKYDSFAICVTGEDLTDVHVGIFDEGTIAQYGDAVVINAVKDGSAADVLAAADLAKVNADGGYYDVVSGVKANTTYYVIVWATNGAMEGIDFATYKTEKLPYVWEELGQGTLTDGFFVSLFGRPDYTVPCSLYKEKNTPGLYMVTDYQLPLVAAFFNITEEEMAQYEGGNWNRTEVVIDATDPNAVVISEQDYGVCVNSAYGFVLIETEPTGVLANGVLTFPVKNMYAGLGGGWYYGNQNGTFEIRFPEALATAPAANAVRSNNGKVESVEMINVMKANRPKVDYERDAQPVKVAAKVAYTRKAAEKNFEVSVR